MEKDNFELMEPSEIRKDSLSFEIMILKALDRIHASLPVSLADFRHEIWFGIEAQIMFLNSFVAPYYQDDYKAKIKEIKNKIKSKRNDKIEYVGLLAEWLEEIVRRFAQVKILPAMRVRHDLPDPLDYEEELGLTGDDNDETGEKEIGSTLDKKKPAIQKHMEPAALP